MAETYAGVAVDVVQKAIGIAVEEAEIGVVIDIVGAVVERGTVVRVGIALRDLPGVHCARMLRRLMPVEVSAVGEVEVVGEGLSAGSGICRHTGMPSR